MINILRKTFIGCATLAQAWLIGLVVFFEHVLGYRISSIKQVHSARAGSKRLPVNVIRNQPAISLAGKQRNRITLDETNIASPQ